MKATLLSVLDGRVEPRVTIRALSTKPAGIREVLTDIDLIGLEPSG
jgi:hypothetical protein